MAKIVEYLSHRAGRERVMKAIGVSTVVGGLLVSTMLLLAILVRR